MNSCATSLCVSPRTGLVSDDRGAPGAARSAQSSREVRSLNWGYVVIGAVRIFVVVTGRGAVPPKGSPSALLAATRGGVDRQALGHASLAGYPSLGEGLFAGPRARTMTCSPPRSGSGSIGLGMPPSTIADRPGSLKARCMAARRCTQSNRLSSDWLNCDRGQYRCRQSTGVQPANVDQASVSCGTRTASVERPDKALGCACRSLRRAHHRSGRHST
jgi:hypothetical protein